MFMTINSFHCNLRPIGKITLLVLILFTSAWKAWALNVFEGWDKAPTFTPPSGCIPSVQNYGVTAQCVMTLKPGRRFFVSIDAARGGLVLAGLQRKRTVVRFSPHMIPRVI
jgi:hypothetical protein